MKEEIISIVGDKLKKLNVWIDDVYVDSEGSTKFLHIVLDAAEIIPINTVVMATRIINPLLDEVDIMEDASFSIIAVSVSSTRPSESGFRTSSE